MSSSTDTKKKLLKGMVLDTKPEIIHDIEVAIEEIKEKLNFQDDVYGNVMVAVTEAINNSIYHGNKEDQRKRIYLDFEMKNDFRLLVRVRDEGSGFDPDSLGDPTAPENLENIGGRGVFLMQHLADEIEFLDDGRIVEMGFNV
jgi:serine/threonine-protein kinase RsbW